LRSDASADAKADVVAKKSITIKTKQMRKFQIIGNLTRDAEVKQISPQRSVINFDVAVNERWRDSQGNKQERTSYVQCALWRDQTTIAQYLLKGVKLYLEGTPEPAAYINKEGKAVASQKMTVREIIFLTSVKKNESSSVGQSSGHQGSSGQAPSQQQEEEPAFSPVPDDDLPF
jgi:single-strand DNA-binding protein